MTLDRLKVAALILTAAFLSLSNAPISPALAAVQKVDISDKGSSDEAALRAQSAQFQTYFDDANAKAIADMFVDDGVLVAANGNESRGRAQIEKDYAEYFTHWGNPKIEVKVQSISFPTSDTAIEVGTSQVHSANAGASCGKYTAMHVKRDGQWQVASVVDTKCAPPPAVVKSTLPELEWLAGNWHAQGPKGEMQIQGSWLGKNSFLSLRFHPIDSSKESDVEMIGWNPLSNQLVSWHFSADGGAGRSTWARHGNDWILNSIGCESDGHGYRSTYILRKVDDNKFTWQSVNRVIAGKPLPDTQEVTVTRDKGNN